MKESEAKTKWCPMVRLVELVANNSGSMDFRNNRGGESWSGGDYECLGRECAWWVSKEDSSDPEGHCGVVSWKGLRYN